MKVSIIVPVYNKEHRLEETINCLLQQRFDDFELLLVDDGSTDGSLRICEKYSKKDNRIRVIHKENGGASSARNCGIDNAFGEYIVFCDADDKMPEDALENMVKTADRENADFVVGGMRNIDIFKSANRIEIKFQKKRTGHVIYKDDIKEQFPVFWQGNNMVSSCTKLYRTDIIKNNNIRFNTDLVVLEDFCFVIDYLNYCTRLISIEELVYDYIVDKDAANWLHRSRMDYVDDVIYAFEQLKKFLKNNHINDDTVFWRSFEGQFFVAYDALWAVKYYNFKQKLKKHKRIHDVLKLEQYQRLIRNNRGKYSFMRYLALKHGSVFGIMICNRLGFK